MVQTSEAPPKDVSPLRMLHDTQVSLEKFRIQVGNRVSALQRGADPNMTQPVPKVYSDITEAAIAMEALIDGAIKTELRNWKVYRDWLQHIKGIGPGLAGQMLALLLPPLPDRGPSTWYKAAGLAPEQRTGSDGETIMRLPRPRQGEGKITYHAWLRRCLWNVATSFVRTGGYYREVYDRRYQQLFHKHCWRAARLYDNWSAVPSAERPEWLAANFDAELLEKTFDSEAEMLLKPRASKCIALVGLSDEQWPLHRIDSVARWITLKFFLSHLWEKWLEAEGHTGRQAFVIEKLGHHYIAPPEPNGKKI